MERNWKEALASELTKYQKCLEKYQMQLNDGKIQALMSTLNARAEKVYGERTEFYKRALQSFSPALSDTLKKDAPNMAEEKILKLQQKAEALKKSPFSYLEPSETEWLIDFIKVYSKAIINTKDPELFRSRRHLMQLLALLGHCGIYMGNFSHESLGSGYAEDCYQMFFDISHSNNTPILTEKNGMILPNGLPFIVTYDIGKGDGYFLSMNESLRMFYILNPTFITNVLSQLSEKEYSSFADFVLSVAERFDCREILSQLQKFKLLYELTPEEIRMYDQKYFAKKQLEQAEEAAQRQEELMQEAIWQQRQQAREDAEYAKEQADLQTQLLKQQLEESRMQAEESRKQAEESRMQAMRAAEQERQKKEEQRINLLRQCKRCKNHCFGISTFPCPSFTPR